MLIMAAFRIKLILSVLLQAYNNLYVDGRKTTDIIKTVGGTVVLECPMDNPLVWSRKTNENALYDNFDLNPTYKQRDRLSLVDKYDLMITNLTKSDEDEYCCASHDNQRERKATFRQMCTNLFVLVPRLKVLQLENGSLKCDASEIPGNYSFLKWQYQTIYGQQVQMVSRSHDELLNINLDNKQPVYEVNGRYACGIRYKDIYDSTTKKLTAYHDVMLTEKPFCMRSKVFFSGKIHGNASLTVHVYSSNVSFYQWSKEHNGIIESENYVPSLRRSTRKVLIHGISTVVDTYIITLFIKNITSENLNKSYHVLVTNGHGFVTCTTTLHAENSPSRIIQKMTLGKTKPTFQNSYISPTQQKTQLKIDAPEVPRGLTAKPTKSGIQVTWLATSHDVGMLTYIIEYRAIDDSNWTTVYHFMNENLKDITDLPPCTCFIVRLCSQNEIGRSGFTNEKKVCTIGISLFKTKWLLLYVVVTSLGSIGLLIGSFIYNKLYIVSNTTKDNTQEKHLNN